MSETFVVSDTHFSHKNIVQFFRPDGNKERPWDNIEEMDEALVNNWNSVVRPKDKVYHLGDVVINRSALPILARLKDNLSHYSDCPYILSQEILKELC